MVRLSDLIRGDPDSPEEGPRKASPEPRPTAQPPPEPIRVRALAGQEEVLEETAGPLADWYAGAQLALRPVVDAIRSRGECTLGDLPMVATAIVTSLARDDRLFVRAVSNHPDAEQIRNLVHVSIFAVKIGMAMGLRRDDLSRLALAGLVHDVGMYRLPDHVLNEPGQWAEHQVAQMRTHPTLGAEVLHRGAPEHPWLPDVVLQEHERANGAGYPRGLKGHQMHEFAQIIGLADVFDALLTARPYRRQRLPHEAIREILTNEKDAFPTPVIKAMVQQFSVYPVGTTVRLNTGEIAVVTKSNGQYPLRPLVQVRPDADGVGTEPKVVDLSKTTLIHIVEVVPVEGMRGGA